MVLVVAFHSADANDLLVAFTVLDTSTDVVNVHRLPVHTLTPKNAEFALKSITMHRAADVVTFNGSGFGFRLLADRINTPDIPYNAVTKTDIAEIALMHTDIFTDFALDRGFRVSLEAACKGIGHPYARQSPAHLWESGQNTQAVDACANEARAIRALYAYASKWGRLRWETASGTVRAWALPTAPEFRPVYVALDHYVSKPPDVSWMKEPPKLDNDLLWALSFFY